MSEYYIKCDACGTTKVKDGFFSVSSVSYDTNCGVLVNICPACYKRIDSVLKQQTPTKPIKIDVSDTYGNHMYLNVEGFTLGSITDSLCDMRDNARIVRVDFDKYLSGCADLGLRQAWKKDNE